MCSKNCGTVQDGGFSHFYFQKIALNQRVNIFILCKLIRVKKYINILWKKSRKK
jgi:hypothetical protein